jgi:glycosyltransferase involved in cell wall biosynthesis
VGGSPLRVASLTSTVTSSLATPAQDAAAAPLAEPLAVVGVMPTHLGAPPRGLLERARSVLPEIVLVDDGSPDPHALARAAADVGATVVRLPRNSGKGHALAAGVEHLLARDPPPQAVLVLDADGQHPPEAIPAFLAAPPDAELVIGDRFGDLRSMPWQRRLANRLASAVLGLATGVAIRDSQCGMRLLRGRALTEVPFPRGGFEAETVHLKCCLRRGVRVAWVPIPALYADQVSSFRALRDSARVLAALLR